MPTAVERFRDGPITYNVGTNTVIGGRLVMPDGTTGTIKHATAGTTLCLGVAKMDARPEAGQATEGYAVTSALIRPDVAVARAPHVYDLTFTANCGWGVHVVCAADGKVTPYTPGTSTFDQIVGKCIEPKGVVVATKVTGRVELYV